MSSTDFPDLLWRKSSHSNGQANCVEVAAMGYGQADVCVRDSKAAEASGLIFPARVWRQFTGSVKPRGSQAGLHHDGQRELPAGPFHAFARRLELVRGHRRGQRVQGEPVVHSPAGYPSQSGNRRRSRWSWHRPRRQTPGTGTPGEP
jgi:Domain of unknown function (DUF397)